PGLAPCRRHRSGAGHRLPAPRPGGRAARAGRPRRCDARDRRCGTLAAVWRGIGGAILWLAERSGSRSKLALDLPVVTAFGIGIAQAFALIPGISRSGISISAGLFAGLRREEAARFSFLMATPITAAAAAYETLQVVRGGVAGVEAGPLAL